MKANYWEVTKNHEYYKIFIGLIIHLIQSEGFYPDKIYYLLDVGTGPTKYLEFFEKDYPSYPLHIIPSDLHSNLILPDIKKKFDNWKVIDFTNYSTIPKYSHNRFDFISCLQTLEHINDNLKKRFIDNLFKCSNNYVIISVPYKWKKSKTPGHTGIDEFVIKSWFNIYPYISKIITEDNGIQRIMNVYKKLDYVNMIKNQSNLNTSENSC